MIAASVVELIVAPVVVALLLATATAWGRRLRSRYRRRRHNRGVLEIRLAERQAESAAFITGSTGFADSAPRQMQVALHGTSGS